VAQQPGAIPAHDPKGSKFMQGAIVEEVKTSAV
jgi:hypothetical protein